MADAYEIMRIGEEVPFFAECTISEGTLTIDPSAVAVTLYLKGAPVAGFTDLPVSGYDASAIINPRVWFNFDSSGLTRGYYTLVFTTGETGSDNNPRREIQNTLINLLDVWE